MSDQHVRTAIYQSLVVHDVTEPVRVTGRVTLNGVVEDHQIHQCMIDLLIDGDFPDWDPNKIRIVEFLWSEDPCPEDPS